MAKILLVEPKYRSKFPPLGLMKIATYHRGIGDSVIFVRGNDKEIRELLWDRIYISSLFTWDLPKTVESVRYYNGSVQSVKDIYVGGVGVTLLPEYIRDQVQCTVIEGLIDKPNMLGRGSRAIAKIIPDYDILHAIDYEYSPENAYFLKITKGCVRSCKFCAVPKLEKEFGYLTDLTRQVKQTIKAHGEKQHMVIMDNNILAIHDFDKRIADIRALGFERGAKRNGRQRTVDFNQGIDARLIAKNPSLAHALGTIAMKPVRLAFDFLSPKMERDYRKSIALLSEQGFSSFTNYMLYNYNDTPEDFYRRLEINTELNNKHGVRISGFPMRYIPITDTQRGHVSPKWKWRWLRGIQCVLQATRGVVSPNPAFIKAAFGRNEREFFEIISMPDRYIIYRKYYKNKGASDWQRRFRRLSDSGRTEFLDLLARLNKDRKRNQTIAKLKEHRALIEHYYPSSKQTMN
ncbi:MAG TPA: hypothetical protein VJL10_07630 [Anaerolineales bacterium]|nr:hypothetical protein [Anaerolineales bacterium]HLB73773.1 hypothetical protein [Sedimentisphaerales bacterium]